MRKKEGNKLQRFFKFVYLKLFRINDSPQKIALGFGLGVFLGILPGTGPIASLFLAILLRLNRASALLGCILTNTWISIVSFVLSIKVGSWIMGLNWIDVQNDWMQFLKDFHWSNFFQLSVIKISLPVILGFIIVSLCWGILGYIISLGVAIRIRKAKNKEVKK